VERQNLNLICAGADHDLAAIEYPGVITGPTPMPTMPVASTLRIAIETGPWTRVAEWIG